jgi:hypothetical protein
MVATTLAAEVAGAIREFGADIDTHGPALGMSVRNLAAPATLHGPTPVDASRNCVIVDKSVTRC